MIEIVSPKGNNLGLDIITARAKKKKEKKKNNPDYTILNSSSLQ